MDARNFDTLTRRFAQPGSRRAFVAAIGAALVARSAKAAAPAAQVPPACGAAGDVCTMALGCCDGMTCATSYMNPSYGVCVSGGSGGMMPVADSIISPEGDGIETQLQAALSTTAVANTTTSAATDKQTRRAAKQSKRSSRRSTRKSKNSSQKSTRQSRRDTRQLNTSPELSLESFTGLGNNSDNTENPSTSDGVPSEALRVTNLDSSSIVVSSVSATLNPSLSASVSATISPGSSYLLLSGVVGDNAGSTNSSLATIWTEDFVCTNGGDLTDPIPDAGYTILASQSGASTSYEFTVLCNQLQSYANVGNGNNHHQQHQQHAQHRRRRRQQQKQHKKNSGK